MAKERGIVTIMVVLSMLMLYSEMVEAGKTFVVGDAKGWTFNVTAWPNGKDFSLGDILEFNYHSKEHNVVIVDKTGYEECKASKRSKTYETGHDQIQISIENRYFISTVDDDCLKGMKIGVPIL